MATTTMNLERVILDAIHSAVGEMVADEAERAAERVKQRVRQEVAGICASATMNMTFERMGADLVIRLRDERGEK